MLFGSEDTLVDPRRSLARDAAHHHKQRFSKLFGGLKARFEVDLEPSGIRSKIFCRLGRPAPADSFRPQSLRNP